MAVVAAVLVDLRVQGVLRLSTQVEELGQTDLLNSQSGYTQRSDD